MSFVSFIIKFINQRMTDPQIPLDKQASTHLSWAWNTTCNFKDQPRTEKNQKKANFAWLASVHPFIYPSITSGSLVLVRRGGWWWNYSIEAAVDRALHLGCVCRGDEQVLSDQSSISCLPTNSPTLTSALTSLPKHPEGGSVPLSSTTPPWEHEQSLLLHNTKKKTELSCTHWCRQIYF